MKIIHIVSSAFNYFDNIKDKVFTLAESQKQLGWEVEVLSLRYGAVSAQETKVISKKAPGLAPAGLFDLGSAIKDLNNFDVVHIHAPFLGVGKIWRYLKNHPEVKVFVTYYGPTVLIDLFAYFVRLYNRYYLPKFFRRAQLVFTWSATEFVKNFSYLKIEAIDLEKATARPPNRLSE